MSTELIQAAATNSQNLTAAEVEQKLMAANENQFLTFVLGDETYGLDILRVQEIRSWSQPTQIPNAPGHIRGVINLRGEIVPILDLRCRFNMDETEFTKYTVVIVVNVQDRTVGMIVDGVSDVVNLSASEMRAAPDFGTSIDSSFIHGLASHDNKMVILLNIQALLADSELLQLDEITAANIPMESTEDNDN
jgi:purine-binding chemotaxis protein CheW